MSAATRSEEALRRRRIGLQQSEHRAVLVTGDLLAALVAVAVAIALWTITAGVALDEALAVRRWWFLAAPVWALGLAPARRPAVALSIPGTAVSVARTSGLLLVVYLGIYFYAPRQVLPRLLAIYFLWEASLLTFAWRLVYVWVFTRGPMRQRMLVAGAGASGETVVRAIEEKRSTVSTVVGFVDSDPPIAGRRVRGLPVFGDYSTLPAVALREHVAQVVLAEPVRTGEQVRHLLACEGLGIVVVPMGTVYEQTLGRVPVAHLEPSWLFTSYAEAVSARDASRLAKRMADVLGALVGTALFLVCFLPVCVAIWLDTGRPVLFRQTRCGRGGRHFQLTKFRTMITAAEADGRPRWTGPGDPRVTRVGRWLRRTRLDELPNFLSVLSGDMSLVGPRPERPEFVEILEREIPLYRARSIVRPGLTGWAQVNHPYGDSVEDAAIKLEYDLYYLKHRSMAFDLWIMLRTLRTVLSLKGR
jgi:exopolysaccharide biosynthesis polyprenyl glycosylphosphotransferase